MKNGELWLDPNAEESSIAKGTLTLSCLPALGTITNIWQIGKITLQEAREVSCLCLGSTFFIFGAPQSAEKCMTCCADIHAIVAQSLKDSMSETKKT